MESDSNTGGSPEAEPPQHSDDVPLGERVKRVVLGVPRDLHDPKIFHRISLVAFLAWVGLGADGLSSSAYGPEEAFRALGEHTYLAIGLVLATAFTIFVISYAYSRIIEHFPYGGGGYVVASKLLGPKYGVVSGSALLVDYVFTISVSIASAADQVFSFLPPEVAQYKLVLVTLGIALLTVMNLRGVKESVTSLAPIFLVFVITHAVLIIGGIAFHLFEAPRVVAEVQNGFKTNFTALGLMGLFAIFARSYTRGAGTYTGIEAVSNGIQIMREPKIQTARRTMLYMAVSLAVTAGGILICYLLYHVVPEAGKTMNASLLERFAGTWQLGNVPAGKIFVVVALASEAAILFVAAQAGFIDGPRVMSNMAIDSWLPHRFSSLSERLTTQSGVVLISTAAILTLLLTGGNTSMLVLMYSINVFLTFSLSNMGMVRYWIQHRTKDPEWLRHILIHIIGLVLCVSILLMNLYEKFGEGGWITILITGVLVGLCILIKRHYESVMSHLARLDEILTEIPTGATAATPPPKLDPKAPTAVLLVSSYGGMGIHTFLSIQRLFPRHFKNFIFLSITVVDAGRLKGAEDLDIGTEETKASLQRYVDFTRQLGFAADYRTGMGTEVLDEAEKIALQIAKEYPLPVFFTGKLVFERERWYQRILHNETANQFQRRVQFNGLNSMVLPIRVFAKSKGA
ncbi:MAG: APC family permease [Ignavibacteriae bacterium]|nr:APC family permease [Ignavibacteria bacterium]MBI3363845.1 APC family permease [Ignavibacteriota bacterium]